MNKKYMIPYQIVKELLFIGVKFQYESYDFKPAFDECRQQGFGFAPYRSHWRFQSSIQVPFDIQEKHKIYRIGKLRSIEFKPDGSIKKVFIGSRYPKRFYMEDFGVSIKPILYEFQDDHGLIKDGLAICKE